ncbi:hypothetical protein ACFSO0_12465 [Brevibacillus sp. GCM10020057]|uniref:hypothetical protein n=1 Tax=Brevibacillus sp. GCM10020057 TaxID=3317327 RepID=UPI003633F6C7
MALLLAEKAAAFDREKRGCLTSRCFDLETPRFPFKSVEKAMVFNLVIFEILAFHHLSVEVAVQKGETISQETAAR